MFRGVIILAAALVVAGGALAQPKPGLDESAKAMIGAWELSNAARDKICTVTFSAAAVKVGYKITFAPDCAGLFPLVQNIAGWRYPQDDLLYWLDAQGKALVEFSEVEDGIFEAPTPGVGVLLLHNPAMAEPQAGENPEGAESPPGGEPPEPPELPDTPAPNSMPKNAPQSAPKSYGG